MRLVVRRSLATAMATGGVLAAAAGCAYADSGAQGTAVGSPGVLSGNLVQLPINVPVNVCGNTVNVVGLLDSAAGNRCANESGGGAVVGAPAGSGSTTHGSGSAAHGTAAGSPGVGSGLAVQLPVHVPVNVTGNSVGVVGVGNPAVGNTSTNGSAPAPTVHQSAPRTPAAPPQQVAHTLPARVSLAHTGADGIGYLAGASAFSLLGGVLLRRGFRPGKAA